MAYHIIYLRSVLMNIRMEIEMGQEDIAMHLEYLSIIVDKMFKMEVVMAVWLIINIYLRIIGMIHILYI